MAYISLGIPDQVIRTLEAAVTQSNRRRGAGRKRSTHPLVWHNVTAVAIGAFYTRRGLLLQLAIVVARDDAPDGERIDVEAVELDRARGRLFSAVASRIREHQP